MFEGLALSSPDISFLKFSFAMPYLLTSLRCLFGNQRSLYTIIRLSQLLSYTILPANVIISFLLKSLPRLFLNQDFVLAFFRVAERHMVFGSIGVFGMGTMTSLSGLIFVRNVISTTVLFPSICDL